MKTYWDYTEQERANLTEQAVTDLLDVELMTSGVKKPVAPKLVEIPKSPLGEKQRFFTITGKSKYGFDSRHSVLFSSLEHAAAFITLKPSFSEYDYEVGTDNAYAELITEPKIEPVELYSKEQVNAFRSELKSRKAKEEANAKAQAAFDAACKQSEVITGKVWKDWHDQRQLKSDLQEIVNTFKEYVRLASGHRPTALKFLQKTYTESDIARAREWFNGEIYELPTVQAA